MTEIFIAGAKRTAIGSFQGQFDGVPATQLGSTAIRAALNDSGLAADAIDEVFMGCVLPANLGQAPARQASLDAGIPRSAGCTTINKVCGSGMKAIMLAHDAIKAGSINAAIAGGMESMTNAPYMLPKARGGYRMGNGEIVDHMMWDGLTNPYDKQAMGVFGEMCVNQFAMTREETERIAIGKEMFLLLTQVPPMGQILPQFFLSLLHPAGELQRSLKELGPSLRGPGINRTGQLPQPGRRGLWIGIIRGLPSPHIEGERFGRVRMLDQDAAEPVGD